MNSKKARELRKLSQFHPTQVFKYFWNKGNDKIKTSAFIMVDPNSRKGHYRRLKKIIRLNPRMAIER